MYFVSHIEQQLNILIEYMKCQCILKTGKNAGQQCKYSAKPSSIFCGIHANCDRVKVDDVKVPGDLTLETLPTDILKEIASHLTEKEAINLYRTSKTMHGAQYLKKHHKKCGHLVFYFTDPEGKGGLKEHALYFKDTLENGLKSILSEPETRGYEYHLEFGRVTDDLVEILVICDKDLQCDNAGEFPFLMGLSGGPDDTGMDIDDYDVKYHGVDNGKIVYINDIYFPIPNSSS